MQFRLAALLELGLYLQACFGDLFVYLLCLVNWSLDLMFLGLFTLLWGWVVDLVWLLICLTLIC